MVGQSAWMMATELASFGLKASRRRGAPLARSAAALPPPEAAEVPGFEDS